MEYKTIKTSVGLMVLGIVLMIPSMAPAYDVGQSDAMRSLTDGYNYRPPSSWKGSGSPSNESGGPIGMDQYLTPIKKKEAPSTQRETDGDSMPGDNVRDGDTR